MQKTSEIDPLAQPEGLALSADTAGKLGSLGVASEAATSAGEVDPNSLPSYHFMEYGADGRVTPASEAVSGAVQTELLRRRAAVLELPSHEDGLNMERVNLYRQAMGAPQKPIRVLSPEDYATAMNIADNPDSDESTHGQGDFLPLLDVIIVKRDLDEEQIYGPGITESRLIHEQAHSSGRTPLTQLEIKKSSHRSGLGVRKATKTQITSIEPARAGFMTLQGTQKRGLLLEEMYPEFERGQYVTEQLGMPNGFIKPEHAQTGIAAVFNKYTFPGTHEDGSANATIAAGSVGAATLELLVSHDPELIDVIRSHRQSPDELDAAVGSHIDAEIPGLYGEMQAIDLDDPNAQRQATAIFARVYQHFQN